MNKLQDKLQFLLDKYSVSTAVVLKNKKSAVIDGEEVPILSHRGERRFLELKNIVNGGTLVGISVMRVARIVERDTDIYDQLYRELDICQYVLQRKIKSIMSLENGNVLNAIATTEDGIVCTLEISATLNNGEIPKDKHEIISQRGIACDVVVDAQLKQDSIYLFGENGNKKFTDTDFELYGLSEEEISIVRTAFNMAKDKTIEEVKAINENLLKLVDAAKLSATNGEREVI